MTTPVVATAGGRLGPVYAGLLLAAPVAVGAIYSLMGAIGLAGPGASGLTARPLLAVVGDAQTWRSLGWTLATAMVATAMALVVACATALWLRARPWWLRLATLPMAVPHVAAALAVLLLVGQSGWISRLSVALGSTTAPADFPALVYDPAGLALIITFAWKEYPYLLLTAVAVLSTDTSDLEGVARTLGASPTQTFRRVTWPLLWRGVAPAVLATFAYLIGQYEVPALLAPGDPLAYPLLAYERSIDPTLTRRAEAHVLGLIALAAVAVLVALHAWWQARHDWTRS
ncbi:MAG: ABC transporter permease subunit [Vicinamibacterales bacterium]